MEEEKGDPALAARVKQLRLAANLTQEDLAKKSKVSLALIRKIETSKRLGSMETHSQLAQTLGVPIGYLSYGGTTEVDVIVRDSSLTDEDWQLLRQMAATLSQLRGKTEPDLTHVQKGLQDARSPEGQERRRKRKGEDTQGSSEAQGA